MKNKRRFLGLIAAALLTTSAWAQTMTFTYAGGTTATATKMSDGSWLMQLPAGTELNGAITGVKVNGTDVDAASVTPNPTTTFITDGEIETFVYDGKAYSFRFIAGEYFTAIIFSDPHVAQDDYDGITVDNMKAFVSNVVNMGKDGGKVVTFSKAPKYVPTADIVFCLGDMDKDKGDGKDFKNAIAEFNTAGIPFITMAGNHDFVPYLWDDETTGVTYEGAEADQTTLNLIQEQNSVASTNGGFTITTFTQSNGNVQPKPFAFEFKGVDFYCGQTYWYQMPYTGKALMSNSTSGLTYYAADGIIFALEEYVNGRSGKPAVWMQHYPFNYGSDCDRWWADQNKNGNSIAPNSASVYTDVKSKKDKIVELMNKTKNPVHFSGHVHGTATNTYSNITDHTIDNTIANAAYVVLCKEGVGVVEVKAVTF